MMIYLWTKRENLVTWVGYTKRVGYIKMLYYDRIDIFKGIDVNKTSALKECIICHDGYSSGKGFKFQQDVCNGCHHASVMSMALTIL